MQIKEQGNNKKQSDVLESVTTEALLFLGVL